MGKVVKGIGKVVSAPVRAVGHALATSHIPGVSNIGSAAEHLGNAVAGKGAFLRQIGQAGQAAAPVVGLIPGVGTLAGAAIGAGGTLLNKGTRANLGDVAKYGAEGALSGLANQKLLGGRGILGVPHAIGSGLDKLGIHGAEGAIGSAARGVGGAVGKVGKGVLDYVLKHPLQAAQMGLAGASTIQGAQTQSRANDYLGQALARGLAPPAPVDLSGVFADPGNPYAGGARGSAMAAARRSLASGY